MLEELTVKDENCQNLRLDIFISKKDPELSRTYIKKLIEDELVFVNNTPKKAGYRIKLNDKIVIHYPDILENKITAENIPLNIIYEDNDLIVIDKPAGMVVHPAPGNYSGTLVNALQSHCKNLSGINGVIRPGIVHRLDKDTSGLMVAAKNDFTHQSLQNMWHFREVNRRYLALVHGIFTKSRFIVNAPIGRDPNNRKKMKVIDKNSRNAITHFELLHTFNNYSILHAKLDTGRTHQVRVHLSFIKHPVVGDNLYGRKGDKEIIQRQALHSALLGFNHPTTKKYMEFKSKLPEDIVSTIITFIDNSFTG